MDLNALRKIQEESETQADGDFLFTKEITKEGIDVRIMPPSPRMAGVPFVKVTRYWINQKPYISADTFGKDCVIQEEINEAKADGDPELLDLVEDKKLLDKKYEYWWAVLHLDAWKENGDKRVKPVVIGDKIKILPCGPMIKEALIKIILSKQAQNGTKEGLADRVKGWNVILSKSGTGKNTEYAAEKWDTPQVMPEKFYDNPICVVTMIEGLIKSDDYLRGVIRNYLYGEDMPSEEDEKKKKKPQAKKTVAKKQEVEEEEEEDEEVETEEEEQEEEDDQEEEEKPTPKKKPTTTTTKPATSTTAKKPAVTNTTQTKKVPKNILEAVEDLD